MRYELVVWAVGCAKETHIHATQNGPKIMRSTPNFYVLEVALGVRVTGVIWLVIICSLDIPQVFPECISVVHQLVHG